MPRQGGRTYSATHASGKSEHSFIGKKPLQGSGLGEYKKSGAPEETSSKDAGLQGSMLWALLGSEKYVG
jgi:hypothetical protein